MEVSVEFLQRCSTATGFTMSTLEKVVHLGAIAADVGRDRHLRPALALKGGTAINLCVARPARMSVDLDFNYIASAERQVMVRDRPAIEAALISLAERLGHRVQRSADAAASRKLYASYRSVLGPMERVEIDINYMWRVPLAGTVERTVWLPGELDRPTVTVVSDIELWVGKFLAFLGRTAARDVWDMTQLPDVAPALLANPEFRKWFIAMSMILDHPVDSYDYVKLERRAPHQSFDEQVAPMLSQHDQLDPTDLLAQAWRIIEPFLQLTPDEKAYVDGVVRGEHRPELIFPSQATTAAMVGGHPQVAWKLENVRRHLASRRPGVS